MLIDIPLNEIKNNDKYNEIFASGTYNDLSLSCNILKGDFFSDYFILSNYK